jgi:LacI family transcriptional regulator
MARSARRVTQADVARLAGVSQATVSHVLSGDPVARARVGEQTRARVVDVVRRTGYTANPIAQRLAGGRNNIVGVFTYEPVFPRDGGDFYYPLLVGIEREAEAQGLDLLLFTSAPVHDGRRRLLEDGARRLGVADGCLLLGQHDDKRDLAELIEQGFPFAFVGRRESDAGLVPYAAADYAGATDEVVSHLVGLGHTAIGFLGDLGPGESHVDRRRGYDQAVRRAGLRPVLLDGTSIDGDTALDLVLDNGLTAVVVGDFVLPPALLEAAGRRGVAVPEDLSLAQLGDPAVVGTGRRWTGFRVPREEMGATALRILRGIIDGTLDDADQQVTLPCVVDHGETAGPVRAPGRGRAARRPGGQVAGQHSGAGERA